MCLGIRFCSLFAIASWCRCLKFPLVSLFVSILLSLGSLRHPLSRFRGLKLFSCNSLLLHSSLADTVVGCTGRTNA